MLPQAPMVEKAAAPASVGAAGEVADVVAAQTIRIQQAANNWPSTT